MKKKKVLLKDIPQKEKSKNHNSQLSNKKGFIAIYLPAILSFIMLVLGMLADFHFDFSYFDGWVRILWYGLAYIPVGLTVVWKGIKSIQKGEFFTEFLLMSIATIGAFAIGEYPEGVAVMLFYAVGELFQDAAVSKARRNIKALLDIRPNTAWVWREGKYKRRNPESIGVGEKIQVKSGEKIPLDGVLLSEVTQLNTAALTGESKPVTARKGEKVWSGVINLGGPIEVETTKIFKDSSVAQIIEMVENASARKSKTELFIRKFARVYTPVVVYAAIALVLVPWFFVDNYIFEDWLYRALIFLVVSCPCALVISIPLGYFGGLGAASKNGILFKGASFLDIITKINTIVFDKTGTLTKGVFKVQKVMPVEMYQAEFLSYLVNLEKKSTHPIAQAVVAFKKVKELPVENVKEVPGQGLIGQINKQNILAGNAKLFAENNISIPTEVKVVENSVVLLAVGGKYAGYVSVSDELKADAKATIAGLKSLGINHIIMLSGDKEDITQQVATKLGISQAKGGLLPEDKLEQVELLKKQTGRKIAFVGDGINDSPVLALSDLGIAMGALGSDVAIETADMVIQTDEPSKILQGIKIGKATRRIVWQNIGLAFGVKAIVLVMGALGVASMWEAVFADVGVAFLAILNAIRLQHIKF